MQKAQGWARLAFAINICVQLMQARVQKMPNKERLAAPIMNFADLARLAGVEHPKVAKWA